MGSCQGSNVIEVKRSGRSTAGEGLSARDLEQLENKMRNDFPDMEEWEGERYSGIGIKRMRGYKCNLPIDKLNEKRNEFWSSKSSEESHLKKTWRVINQACVYDECNYHNITFKIFRQSQYAAGGIQFGMCKWMH